MNETPERGLALLSDAAGMILRVLRNDLRLPDALPGRLFLRLVDYTSRIKAMNFLATIKETGAVFDWELNVTLPDGPVLLHFSGGQIEEQMLIVGAANKKLAARLYEDLLHMSNEHTNLLRAISKEKTQADRAEREAGLYDEISRLNNELVAMQRELAKKNAELERLNALKNQFLGMAAHDLHNPLHLIMSFSDTLLEDAAAVLSAEQREYLQHVLAASEFMRQLIDDFLSVALIESGRLRLNLEVVNLPDIVEQVMILVGVKARKKDIEIIVTQDPALPRLIMDGQKIQQALINLLSNAIEHSYPGSSVALRTRHADDEALIEVQDHGVGIAPDDISRLFDPFARKQSNKTGGEKSTGLGLTISRQIVTRHGGKIWLESELGKGTTFFVALPLQPPENIA
jgi:signal transduction histidine kinase